MMGITTLMNNELIFLAIFFQRATRFLEREYFIVNYYFLNQNVAKFW